MGQGKTASKARHYANNRDKTIARSVARQRENKEEKSARDKVRYAANKEAVLAKQKHQRATTVWTAEEIVECKKKSRDYYARRAQEPEFRERHRKQTAKYTTEKM